MKIAQFRLQMIFAIFFAALLLVFLPLAGVLVTGRPVGQYLNFPPLTGYVQHAPFNLLIFGAGVLFFLFTLLFFVHLCRGSLSQQRDRRRRAFPLWGWGGLLLCLGAWVLAWNRFSWFSTLQPYTFTPLWFGYILSVNGVTFKRSGTCLPVRYPNRFLLLFLVSSLFWWYFEWMNRFVQNWYYAGINDFSALAYILHATLCFSTVLPAVVSTRELLSTFDSEDNRCCHGPILKFRWGARAGWILLVFMGTILAALAIVPDQLFPFVWIAPLLIIVGLQGIVGRQTIFASLRQGDWRPVLLPALAAIICGFFWEMWNWKSLAHWEYSIPYVDRYHLFAMPVLGYLGYLPFGLECQVIAENIIDLPLGEMPEK